MAVAEKVTGCRQQRICGWGGRGAQGVTYIVRLPQNQQLTNFDPGVDFNCLIFNETNNVCVACVAGASQQQLAALAAPKRIPPKPPPRQPLPSQPQAVEHDGDGAECHGGAGPHGIQEQTGDGEKHSAAIGIPRVL